MRGEADPPPARPRPTASRGLVVRPRLIELIELVAEGQTVVIAAPAGWGKSELLSSWEERRRSSTVTAWVGLERGDDAPRRFWRRFFAGIAAAEWADGPLLGLLEVAPEGEVEGSQIVRAIRDRVPDDARPLTIVIDDVHHLAGGESAEELSQLLRHRPPSWRLVLSGRSLPLPLMRLRVAGSITSIGRAELAFDEREAATLLEDAGCRPAPADVAALVAATEGWAAGLRLAAMPLSRGEAVDDVLAGVRAGRHDIERYFQEEVLGSLPVDAAELLLATCISPTLDGRLAQHLSGRDDAGVLLRSLAESGVFTAADRTLPGAFRYHPLLAESLERHLAVHDPARRIALHRAAAHWHRERGSSDLAFMHAVESEEWLLAVELVGDMWIAMLVGGEVDALGRLLDRLPSRIVDGDPELRAIQSLAMLDRAGTAQSVDDASHAPAASQAELLLAIEVARRAGRPDIARTAAWRILSGETGRGAATAHLGAYVLLSVGVAEYWASDRTAAQRDLRDALAEAERDGLDYLRLGCLSQLVGVLTAQNRVNDAADLAEVAAALAIKRGWEGSRWAAELWHALGWISYLRGELDAATDYLERAERSVWRQDAAVGAIIPTIAALVTQLRGRFAEAKALLDLADARLPAARESYVFLAYVDAEQARHAVRGGELRRARELLAGGIETRSLHHCVAMAELLVAERRTDDARRVLRRGLGEADGFLDQRLHVMALLSSLEDGPQGRAVMIEALQLAAPERIVQPFCQVGAHAMVLIGEIARSHRTLRPFTTEIRERFAELTGPDRSTRASGPEELTAREIEVLRLLDGHDTLAEIAATLHVSTNTLKVHTRHVYNKLAVSSRRDALIEAGRRGLL